MAPERRARITWSAARIDRGLPAAEELIAPAWFEADPPGAEGWSLVCRFEHSPEAQGSPSIASVAFMMPDAPHERLAPGARLRLYEGGRDARALVEVLE
jgi:hypothetical protein